MENSPVMFKNAVGGFDKRSVMNYIFELNESSQAAQKKLIEQLEEVTQAREALDQQLAEVNKKLQKMQGEMQGLTTELTGERTRSSELAEMVDNLNAEIEKQRGTIAQKEEEIAKASVGAGASEETQQQIRELNHTIEMLRTEGDQLRRTIAEQEERLRGSAVATAPSAGNVISGDILQKLRKQEETITGLNAEVERLRDVVAQKDRERGAGAVPQNYKELQEKEREIDRVSAQIGRLLLEASADADKIRNEAQSEGERIIYRANHEAEGIIIDARRKSKVLEQRYVGFRSEIDEIQRRVLLAVSEMQSKAEAVGNLMDDVEDRLMDRDRDPMDSQGFFR